MQPQVPHKMLDTPKNEIKINDNYVNPEKAYLLTIDELITYSK